MPKQLRVLHIENSEPDVALLTLYLTRAGYEPVSERVETAAEMKAALEGREWDVILCDFTMPQFNARAAFEVLRETGLDIPFIIISGSVADTVAVEAMHAGVNDYLMKDNLTRLGAAIERELLEAENRRARRDAEEQLRLQSAAVRAAANAIMITDLEGKIVWVNPAFSEHTGYSMEEVRGKNPRLLRSGKQDQAFYREMWDTILAGKVWRNTLINRRKDGTMNLEDLTITPIRDAAGTITHFVGIKQDISKLVAALKEVESKNEQLTNMTQQLWQASKLATMGELAASIAHELNNPLSIVGLRTEDLLSRLSKDSDQAKPLKIIAQEVERMGTLVNNLLQFTRRGHRQVSTVNVCEEITNSVEFVQYFLRTKKVNTVCEFSQSLPTIQADRQQLRQLFLNLLTNASDAMPTGGNLALRVLGGRLNGVDAVVAEFADSGEGILPADLERLWEPFFTTKPEGKGTGLGLGICRRIVEEHGATIDIESERGRGTTVRMVFPATAAGTAP